MDNDISHAVEDRLSAIEARLDKLDGGPPEEPPTEEPPPEVDASPPEDQPEVTPYSSRTKKSTS